MGGLLLDVGKDFSSLLNLVDKSSHPADSRTSSRLSEGLHGRREELRDYSHVTDSSRGAANLRQVF